MLCGSGRALPFAALLLSLPLLLTHVDAGVVAQGANSEVPANNLPSLTANRGLEASELPNSDKWLSKEGIDEWYEKVQSKRKRSTVTCIYNRVRKTGSSTMLKLSDALERKNGFGTLHHGESPKNVATFKREGRHRTWSRTPREKEVRKFVSYIVREESKCRGRSFLVDYHW